MIKSTPTKAASTGGTETRLVAGAAAGSSSLRKDGTDVDVSVDGAFSTPGVSRTPKGNDAGNNAGNEDDDDEDPSLDSAAVTTALEGQASDERGTLRTQCL
jgi:hypothetical protein